MKIGIDARMYGPEHSGLGRYIEQLVEQLKILDDTNEYVIFLKREQYDTFRLPNKKWKKVLADIHWYTVGEQVKFPFLIQKEDVDVMHFPHWNVPLLYRGQFVLTIHDLIMFHFPRPEATTHGPFMYAFKDFVHRFVVRMAAKRATHIITTSEFTKHDIAETLNVDVKKISVTYQAPLKISECRMQNAELFLQKHNIQKPYVLYVGNAYPHKNLERLIEAWNIFSEEHTTYQLVLAGKNSLFYERLKNIAAEKQSVSTEVMPDKFHNVVFTGYVSDEELNVLYTNAHLFVFPSLYEGFGLPPLEAMTHGVPVVSSSASCMPEVLGSAAMYFDPEDVQDIARVVEAGVQNADMRYDMKQKATGELQRYSWKNLAKKTLQIYKKV